jgi:hypothetical protein
MPSKILVLGATMLALNERGEELGEPGNIAERKFAAALAAEIELDRMRGVYPNQFEMFRD